MQVVLPEQALPAKLTFNPELRMNDDEYYDFCMTNEKVRFERTAQGEIVIIPPVGGESDYRNTELSSQLGTWAKRDEARHLVLASGLSSPAAPPMHRMPHGCRMRAWRGLQRNKGESASA